MPDRMDTFIEDFAQILRMATEAGMRNAPLTGRPGQPFRNTKHRRTFVAQCHRGFDEAQNSSVGLLAALEDDHNLDRHEKEYRVLLRRKLAEHLAWAVLQGNTYVTRR